MSDEIAPGDVVRLKSGGPKMTVTDIDEDQFTGQKTVWCEWFDENRIGKRGDFSLVAVERYVPPPQPRVIRA
jgi:uncharacterized protein YodC (DUF2158 family)